jgi:Ca2+-transporting ATPase
MIATAADAETFLSQIVRVARHSGRVRLEVPGLAHDHALASRIEGLLRGQAGVQEVRADPRSGRVLVEYAPSAPVFDRFEAALAGRARRRRAPRRSGAAGAPVTTFALADAFALEVGAVVARLGGDLDAGLGAAEAAARLARSGPNLFEPVATRSRLVILGAQLANLPTALLGASAAVSLVLGDVIDATAISLAVALNAGLGYRIERKNEELLASWRRLEAGEAQVIRGGALGPVPAAELVPGDLLVIQAGDVVPADARVVDAHRLAVDEAALTGESEPQRKGPEPVPAPTPLAERTSMLWAGGAVVNGRGRALVTATGGATELARVRALLETTRTPPAPLERRLGAIVRRVSWLGVGSGFVAAAAGLLHARAPVDVARSAVALGVAAIPEGLPVTSTAALVRSMSRMRRHGMVVRRMSAAETLGGVTVVCADKTGTLTQNRMRLEVVEVDGRRLPARELRAVLAEPLDDPVSCLLAAAVLNSDVDVHLNGDGSGVAISGSSTERALLEAAEAAGLSLLALRRRFPRRRLHERRDGVHFVVSLHDDRAGGGVACMKGAPEQVLPRCAGGHDGRALDDAARAAALAANERLAGEGLRVLAVACARLPTPDAPAPPDGWRYLGLCGLRDPLREHAAQAVCAAARAGIRTLILTGDQRATAAAVAREVGLRGEVLDGGALAAALRAGDPDAARRLRDVAVLARVSPADKLVVVVALRRAGEVVAMAGDGINDAPALKAADVGIAVGADASDMARQTADVVLQNADLRSVLTAVGEGRIVQDNLRRAVRFLMATNLSEVALVLGGALFGREPIAPLQLLWINLLTDTLPALALALEPGEPDVLDRPPARPDAPILDGAAWRRVARDGLLLGALGGAAFTAGGPTAAFATLTAGQLGYTMACRAGGTPVDRRTAALVGGATGMQLAALTLAPLRGALRVAAPGPVALAGFGLGLLLPAALGRRRGGEIVVRGGGAP